MRLFNIWSGSLWVPSFEVFWESTHWRDDVAHPSWGNSCIPKEELGNTAGRWRPGPDYSQQPSSRWAAENRWMNEFPKIVFIFVLCCFSSECRVGCTSHIMTDESSLTCKLVGGGIENEDDEDDEADGVEKITVWWDSLPSVLMRNQQHSEQMQSVQGISLLLSAVTLTSIQWR